MPFIGETSIRTGAAGAGGYVIDQSIRFNDDDAAYLYRDVASAPTDGKKFTYSVWIKRGAITGGTSTALLSGGSGTSTGRCDFVFTAGASTGDGTNNDSLKFDIYSGGFDQTRSIAKLRDPSAWYHIVFVFDAANATANDTMIMYLNGDRLELDSTSGVPNVAALVNANGQRTRIGADASVTPVEFDGYMAEINMIDGQALAPTDFGETNTDGVWVPKKYAGTYGTNGFYITGADSADLGADDSGNGNDFTSTGLTAADQVTDSPTDNYATLNPLLKHSSVTLADGNLEVSSGTNGWFGSVGTVGIQLGDKVYFEGKCLTDTRLYFGLSRINGTGGSVNPISFSTFEGNRSDTDYMWRVTSADTVYYQTTDQGVTVSAVSVNDIVGCSVDTDGTVKFYKNGTEIHSFPTKLVAGDTYMPVYSVNGATSTEKWEVRFGSTGISHQPAGFSLLRTSDMDNPTIADPSAYFQTTLYTGDGSSSNEVNQTRNSTFEPSMVWIKSRSAATDHVIQDQVRGNFVFYPNLTNAEGATGGGWVKSFDSDGFTTDVNVPINASGATFAAWQWKAAGSGSSNIDGSITSTVSVDTTSGFSIVSYSGNGTAGATVGHGLGATPDLLIVKNRDGTEQWIVYHSDQGATKYGLLNSTAAFATSSGAWNDTEPTSSVVTLGGGGFGTNVSANDMIMYAFTEVEGFSKFGTYTGNGSTDGPFIYTGFMPEFIIVKSTSNAGTNWDMLDATREPFNDRGNQFETNTSDAEANNDHNCDFLSNGFKWRDGSGSNNGSGYNIIYMAFARSPFKTGTAQ